jgi:hypothetical protein
MRRTITICAYRRADYLSQVLAALEVALAKCREYEPYHIAVCIDGDSPARTAVREVAESFCARQHSASVIEWPTRWGAIENLRLGLQYAFMELQSDFNLQLEDDVVLSPDALRLAVWFSLREWVRCVCMTLHSHSFGGEDPTLITKRKLFGTWGIACFRWQWRDWIGPNWNYKQALPCGWDYALSRTVWRNDLYTVTPVLGRVRNIGKYDGNCSVPEIFDEQWKGHQPAGPDQMREIGDFRLDPNEPQRPEWVWGE